MFVGTFTKILEQTNAKANGLMEFLKNDKATDQERQDAERKRKDVVKKDEGNVSQKSGSSANGSQTTTSISSDSYKSLSNAQQMMHDQQYKKSHFTVKGSTALK